MQFSVFAIAVLAAATSSSCMIAATATAAAARKTKVTKKGGSISGSYGAIGPSTPDGNPPGGYCATSDDCAIPADLTHGFCAWCGICQSGQPGAICDQTSDCAIPPGLEHGVCVDTCQSGQPGSSCDQTSDCVVQNDLDPPHAVCRGTRVYRKCQR